MTRWLLILGLWGMLAGTAWAEHRGLHSTEMWVSPHPDKMPACYAGEAEKAQGQYWEGFDYKPGEAPTNPRIQFAPDPPHNLYGDFDAGVLKVNGQSLCEAKMQAAMEAMDKWIHSPVPYTDEQIVATQLKWDEAKACWRKP